MSDDTNAAQSRAPAEELIPGPGEAGDTGLVDDSEAAGGNGATVEGRRGFAQQDADKHPGDGPDARD